MIADFVIRNADLQELPEAAAVINEAIGEGSIDTRTLGETLQSGIVLVAVAPYDLKGNQRGRIASVMVLRHVIASSAMPSFGLIVFLATRKAFRGRGLTARLVVTAADWALGRGIGHLAACGWLSGAPVQSVDILRRAGFVAGPSMTMARLIPARRCLQCSGPCQCQAQIMVRAIDLESFAAYKAAKLKM